MEKYNEKNLQLSRLYSLLHLFFLTLLLLQKTASGGEKDYLGMVGLGAGLAIGLAAFGGGIAQGNAAKGALEGIARNPQAV